MDYLQSKLQGYQWDLVQYKRVRSVYALSRDGIPELYVKICHPTSYFQRLRNLIYPKTLKELDKLKQLHTAGFSVPDVVNHLRHGYISALVTKAIFPSISLIQLPDSKKIDVMLSLACDLLKKGFYYGDCHADNIILDETHNPYLVDAYSIFPINRLWLRTVIKLFSQIATFHNISDTILVGYLRSLLPEQDYNLIAHKIQNRSLMLRRRLVRRRAKRSFRQGSFSDIRITDAYKAVIRRDTPITLDKVIANHQQNILKRTNILKYKVKTQLSIVGSFCVKSYRKPKPLTNPYARRAWKGLMILYFNRIPVADPLALVEFNDKTSLLVTRFIPERNLNRVLYHDYHSMEIKEKMAIARKLGKLLGIMHEYNIYHADLKASNIKILRDPVSFILLDTDKVSQKKFLSRKKRIKNMAQINNSIPRHVSRSVRMAFIHAYTSVFGDAPRDLFRDSWELSSQKVISYRTNT